MKSIEQLQQHIQHTFDALKWEGVPAELYAPIAYTLALGGKRLRPLLVLASCDMFGGDRDDAIHPAIGFELFHNFTLLHDDIMDQAPLRRGKETVYKKWNANLAILSGDTMFALAGKYLVKTQPRAIAELVELYNQTAIEVCEGQQFDMNFETAGNVSIDEYIEMIRLKTAVLIGACLKAGAIIANASTEQLQRIYNVGIYSGLAFQLKDDLLDAYGSVEKFGKMIGGDIRVSKKSFLYLKTLVLLGSEKEKFAQLYTSATLSPDEKVKQVMQVFDSVNIADVTRNEINLCSEKAMQELSLLGLPEANVSPLRNYLTTLISREA